MDRHGATAADPDGYRLVLRPRSCERLKSAAERTSRVAATAEQVSRDATA
ncbi:hypothetical protein [Actinacidiphila glaucinigra]